MFNDTPHNSNRSEYWDAMTEILERNFEKGKCAERGKALVMLAEIEALLQGKPIVYPDEKPTSTSNDWEERFDEKYPEFSGVGAQFPIFKETPNRNRIKSFIYHELEQAWEEGYEEGLHETAIKADKDFIQWLKDNSDSSEVVEALKKQARRELVEKMCEELEKMKVNATPLESLVGLKINEENIKELVKRSCDRRQNEAFFKAIEVVKKLGRI